MVLLAFISFATESDNLQSIEYRMIHDAMTDSLEPEVDPRAGSSLAD